MNTIRIRKLQAQLVAAATAGSGRRAFSRIIAESPESFPDQAISDIEAAIATIVSTELREEYAALLHGAFDRVSFTRPPNTGGLEHWAVAVPFVFETDDAPGWLARRPLATLAPKDYRAFSGGADPDGASANTLLLTIPLVRRSAADRRIVAMTLGIAPDHLPSVFRELDSVGEELGGDQWEAFTRSELPLTRVLFAYVFKISATAEVISSGIPQTPFLQQRLLSLQQHVAHINSIDPKTRIRLLEPCLLSAACAKATNLEFAEVVDRCFDDMYDVFRRGDFSPSDNLNPAESVIFVDAPYHCDGYQLMQAAAFSADGALLGFAESECPVGTIAPELVDAVKRSALERDDEVGATYAARVQPPGICEHKVDTTVRDVSGRWMECALATLIPFEHYLKTADWHAELKDPTYFGRAESAAVITARNELLSVPMPVLWERAGAVAAIKRHYRQDIADEILRIGTKQGVSHSELISALTDAYPDLARIGMRSKAIVFPPNVLYLSAHLTAARGTLLSVRQTLSQRMLETDLDAGLPLRWLHAPFADCYFHLQTPLQLGAPETTGSLEAVGWFACERALLPEECEARDVATESRLLEITGVIRGPEDFVKMTGTSFDFVVAPEDDRDFSTVIMDSVKASIENKEVEEEEMVAVARMGEFLLLAGKVLIYCAMRSARMVPRAARTELMSRVKAATGSQRKHLLERARRTMDYVEIGPEEDPADPEATISSGRTMRPHPRRGFIKAQPHGPRNSLRRPQWIAPTFVNFSRGSPDSKPKPYEIT